MIKFGGRAYFDQRLCVLANFTHDENVMKLGDYIWSCAHENGDVW